jgi:hypothetical protein
MIGCREDPSRQWLVAAAAAPLALLAFRWRSPMRQRPEGGDGSGLDYPEGPVGGFAHVLWWDDESVLGAAGAEFLPESAGGRLHPHGGAGVLDHVFGVLGPSEDQSGTARERPTPANGVVREAGGALGGEDESDAVSPGSWCPETS